MYGLNSFYNAIFREIGGCNLNDRFLMAVFHLVHLLATCGFCVLLWVVQLVIYPQMTRVREEDFRVYHEHHCWGISWIVGPLFLTEAFCAFYAFSIAWQKDPVWQWISLFLFLINTSITGLWFAPAHGKLARGWQDGFVKKLVMMNAWRTLLSTLRFLVVFYLVAKELRINGN